MAQTRPQVDRARPARAPRGGQSEPRTRTTTAAHNEVEGMTDEALMPVAFERIVEALNRRKVKYVVIGGVAALLQGVPLPRTADLDVTPASDLENKKRLALVLRSLEAKLRAPGLEEGVEIPLDEGTFTGMVTMTFLTRFGPFDISFVPDGTSGYDDLNRNVRIIERFGVRIPVASLDDIIRSKRAAGREKDASHLVVLLDFLSQSDIDEPDEVR